ncbi:hypothetical protein ACFWNN_37300 [Lentzea sp. NPDC058450]
MISGSAPFGWPRPLVCVSEPVRRNKFLPALGLPALWALVRLR